MIFNNVNALFRSSAFLPMIPLFFKLQFDSFKNENIDEVISIFEEVKAELVKEGKYSASEVDSPLWLTWLKKTVSRNSILKKKVHRTNGDCE